MDVLLIIMICVVSLLLLYVNIYLLALYCHPEDGGFSASLMCKIIVVFNLTSNIDIRYDFSLVLGIIITC